MMHEARQLHVSPGDLSVRVAFRWGGEVPDEDNYGSLS